MTEDLQTRTIESAEDDARQAAQDSSFGAGGDFKKDGAGGGKDKKPDLVEHSYFMRVAAFAMIITVITGACMYANTIPAMTCLYLWMAGMGIFLSYRFRVERPVYVTAIPFVGALIVIGAFVTITAQQIMSHNVNFAIPFLQVLAGLQALHCFDLRTRDDFSISVLIALGVFTFTALVANDYLFVLLALCFMVSLSFLLYFDSVSRSRGVGPSRPVGEGRPASLPNPIASRSARAATAAILIPIVCVPLASVMVFFVIPRSDSIIEWLVRDIVGPRFAISNSAKGKGYNPNVDKPGSNPLGMGKGMDDPDGEGIGGKGSGRDGGKGDPKKGISPLGRKEGDPDDTSGIAGGKGEAGEAGEQEEYEETVEEEPEKVDLLDSGQALEQIVFRVHAPRAGYSKRTTYDFYDGKTWSRSGPISGIAFKKDRGNVFGVGNANALLVPVDCPTVEVRQQITVDSKSLGSFLPCFWIPQAVGGGFDKLTVQADGSLKTDEPIAEGKTYEVVSLLPVYKINEMRQLPLRTRSAFKESILGPSVKEMAEVEDSLVEKYLQLPADLSPKLIKLSQKVAGQKGNWFTRAENISSYLRKNCKYQEDMKDRSDNGDFVYNFLYRTRKGNCIEFASAFVVMCRAAGIPARCVGGYLPGDQNKKTGFFEVRVKHGHAWGEIYVPNWSWIPFDATPMGSYPEVEKDENMLSRLADLGFSNPFGGVLSNPSPSLGAGLGKGIAGSELDKAKHPEKFENAEDEKKNGFEFLGGLADFRWDTLAYIFILVATGAVVVLYYSSRKKGELEVLPENARRSTLIYLELLGDLKRYRIVRLPSDSPNDLKERIQSAFESVRSEGQEIPADLEPMLEEFLEVYNKQRFGREEKVEELEAMSGKIKELVRSNKVKIS